MRKSLIYLGLALVLISGLSGAYAQSVSRFTALNHYVAFTNECIHSLTVIQDKLSAFNQDSYAWYNGQQAEVPGYRVHEFLHSYAYFNWRQGLCKRVAGARDAIQNLESLYELTKVESGQIPEQLRAELNQHRDELMFIMIRILEVSDSLEHSLEDAPLITPRELISRYKWLSRMELYFHDFQAMRDKLAFSLKEAAGPPNLELRDLLALLFHSQQLIQGVRHAPESEIPIQLKALDVAIRTAEANQATQIARMKKMDLYHSRDLTGYRYLIQYSRDIWKIGHDFLDNKVEDPALVRYGKGYYYYNQRLLPAYNHYDNGMSTYYNGFVQFANMHVLQQVEEVPWFRVWDLPPETIIQNEEQEERDPQKTDPHEDTGRNHLVFLLDISASMNKPEKLPLLKAAMVKLLPLLHPEDKISIVSYSGVSRLVLAPVSATAVDEISGAIDQLRPGGKTHLRQGVRIAYQTAESHFIEGGNNRIILATDGAFRLSESMLRKVARKYDREIPLSVFFLGKKIGSKSLLQLEELAQAGGGNYAHIIPETVDEALQTEANALQQK